MVGRLCDKVKKGCGVGLGWMCKGWGVWGWGCGCYRLFYGVNVCGVLLGLLTGNYLMISLADDGLGRYLLLFLAIFIFDFMAMLNYTLQSSYDVFMGYCSRPLHSWTLI